MYDSQNKLIILSWMHPLCAGSRTLERLNNGIPGLESGCAKHCAKHMLASRQNSRSHVFYFASTCTSHADFANTDLMRSDVVEIAQRVVELSLHDSEVLVQLVHDVTAVLVQVTTVGLLPCPAFDQKGVFQRICDEKDWPNAVRWSKICDLVFQYLQMSYSKLPSLRQYALCECKTMT